MSIVDHFVLCVKQKTGILIGMNKRVVITGSLLVLILIAGLLTWYLVRHNAKDAMHPATSTQSAKPQTTAPAPQPAPAPQTAPELVAPIDQFKERITKKNFGTYVTPQNSPVQPERFQGYHAGVDVEYGDVTTEVPVRAIAAGTVTYAGWVSGYGGAVIIRHQISGAAHAVLYGHLDPAALPAVGANVSQSQQIGHLGQAYSRQTDGERRHLHFAVLAGVSNDFRGYSPTQAGLSAWINPLSLPF